MDYTENNKIIAEFMGMKPHDINELDGFWTNTIKSHKFDSVMNLQFHSNWNWLMEVVEKIESLGYDVFINTCVCRITDVGQDILEDIETFNNENKIQAVYNACVEFIKYYNERQKL
jgi:hypothetical protein